MIYVTSDLHFGHAKQFIYEPRGFPNIVDHDEEIIKRWNELVQPEDEVYILGDLMLKDNEHGLECLKRLMVKSILSLETMIQIQELIFIKRMVLNVLDIRQFKI